MEMTPQPVAASSSTQLSLTDLPPVPSFSQMAVKLETQLAPHVPPTYPAVDVQIQQLRGGKGRPKALEANPYG